MTDTVWSKARSDERKALLREDSLAARLRIAKCAIENTVLRLIPEDLVCYPPSEVNPEGGALVHHIIDSHVMAFLEDLGPFLGKLEAFLEEQQAGSDVIRDLMAHHYKED